MATNVLMRDVPSKRYAQVGATGNRFFTLEGAVSIPQGAIVCRGFMQWVLAQLAVRAVPRPLKCRGLARSAADRPQILPVLQLWFPAAQPRYRLLGLSRLRSSPRGDRQDPREGSWRRCWSPIWSFGGIHWWTEPPGYQRAVSDRDRDHQEQASGGKGELGLPSINTCRLFLTWTRAHCQM
jgi:hypothetical protein